MADRRFSSRLATAYCLGVFDVACSGAFGTAWNHCFWDWAGIVHRGLEVIPSFSVDRSLVDAGGARSHASLICRYYLSSNRWIVSRITTWFACPISREWQLAYPDIALLFSDGGGCALVLCRAHSFLECFFPEKYCAWICNRFSCGVDDSRNQTRSRRTAIALLEVLLAFPACGQSRLARGDAGLLPKRLVRFLSILQRYVLPL